MINPRRDANLHYSASERSVLLSSANNARQNSVVNKAPIREYKGALSLKMEFRSTLASLNVSCGPYLSHSKNDEFINNKIGVECCVTPKAFLTPGTPSINGDIGLNVSTVSDASIPDNEIIWIESNIEGRIGTYGLSKSTMVGFHEGKQVGAGLGGGVGITTPKQPISIQKSINKELHCIPYEINLQDIINLFNFSPPEKISNPKLDPGTLKPNEPRAPMRSMGDILPAELHDKYNNIA